MNPFVRFEHFWRAQTSRAKQHFTGLIRDELPAQTYLHLALWYLDLGLDKRAAAVLESCPDKNDEICYYLAYLHRGQAGGAAWLQKATAGDPHFVFPYRAETSAVMQWAEQQSDSWKPRYYQALVAYAHGQRDAALQLLQSIGGQTGFAPLYVMRARLRASTDTAGVKGDYQLAAKLSSDWHYGQYLCSYLLSLQADTAALSVIAPYYKADPENYVTGMLYVRCLMSADRYAEAEQVLDGLHILPYEGARAGHRLYTRIKLMRALAALRQQHYKVALQKVAESRLWPEHLGEGKPYPAALDDSLQEDMEKLIRDSRERGTVDRDQLAQYRAKIAAIGG